ncbi:hypothetical protein [Pelagicoccus sp. SDUM812002]|uniref:hypothetical protein n=1 Tax=Pelagicoccus sp. SDUM812002 TaxID=3041266 RepID=UPI00281085AA|nr:hypothetical protein [Pelagicoccus sp. SDUM812002]MDQ8184201.1 hypothetical protein [Pelagicoccus sp. SDUM812002]
MSGFSSLLEILDFSLPVSSRRYHGDAAAVLDIATDRVAVVGLVGKQEAAIHKSSYPQR